ncbi:truncated transcription factor CAULIFLOWER A-like protein [Tanacetum coccineum]
MHNQISLRAMAQEQRNEKPSQKGQFDLGNVYVREFDTKNSLDNSDVWKTSSDHVEDIFYIRKYQESWTLESSKLRTKTEILERNIRHYGGEDLELLSLRDLQNEEQQLETTLTQIRKKKVSGSDISSFMDYVATRGYMACELLDLHRGFFIDLSATCLR